MMHAWVSTDKEQSISIQFEITCISTAWKTIIECWGALEGKGSTEQSMEESNSIIQVAAPQKYLQL